MTVRKRISLRALAKLGAAALLAAAACSISGGSDGAHLAGTAGGTGTATGTAGGFSQGTGGDSAGVPVVPGAGGAAGADNLPPEKEVDSSYKAPVATGHFVWIANPTSGRVAYVDASSLAVKTVEAGNGPTYLAAVPGVEDAVVVLNALSNDATFLRANGGTLESRTIEGVAAGSNAWAVSPDGHWAIAWTDARLVPSTPATEGFHDVSIIDLQAASGDAKTLAVGYRPVSVSFAADSSTAFAVTQDGVSVVALAKGAVVDTVPLGANGATDPEDTHDVSVTPEGKLAVVRRDGSASVAVVDLASHARTEIPLSGVVTDVDVSADGARAVAVVRATAEVAILPLAGRAPAPADVVHVAITGETVGQVTLTAGGSVAVLYSNAFASERLSVLTLGSTPAFHVVRLHAPVLSALPTPDGKFAVVLHDATLPPSGAAMDASADGGASDDAGVVAPVETTAPPPATAFSLAPLDGTQPPRIETADAPIQAVAIAPTSDRVLLTVRDDAKQIFGAVLGFMPTLEVHKVPLASPPIAAGVVSGANRGYVAQAYADGRITFLSLDGGDARTLTGYELGARVVQWSP
jgi:hypothetical protein